MNYYVKKDSKYLRRIGVAYCYSDKEKTSFSEMGANALAHLYKGKVVEEK